MKYQFSNEKFFLNDLNLTYFFHFLFLEVIWPQIKLRRKKYF